MSTGADWVAMKAAAATLVRPLVNMVVTYELHPDVPWMLSKTHYQKLCEIEINEQTRTPVSQPRDVQDRTELRFDLWMPMSAKGESSPLWDAFVPQVAAVLTNHRDCSGAAQDSDPPRVTLNRGRWYKDVEKSVYCHFCRIEWECLFDWEYDAP